MARLGRTIPNRPIIGRPQLVPVAAAVIRRTSYVVRAVDTGRRVRGRTIFGRAWKLPTIRATAFIVKPARTGKPVSRVIYGRAQLWPAVYRRAYVVKPARTGKPVSRVIYGRAKITSVALTPIARYSYFVKPARPLRRTWQVKYGRAIIAGASPPTVFRFDVFATPVFRSPVIRAVQ